MDTLKASKKGKATSSATPNIPETTSNPVFSSSKFDPDIQDVASDQEGDQIDSDPEEEKTSIAHVRNNIPQ